MQSAVLTDTRDTATSVLKERERDRDRETERERLVGGVGESGGRRRGEERGKRGGGG